MTEYTVIWNVQVDAETPLDAAKAALEMQRDDKSSAMDFLVVEGIVGVATGRPHTEVDIWAGTAREFSAEESMRSAVQVLKNAGMTQARMLHEFAPVHHPAAERARRAYGSEDIQIDSRPLVSRAEDGTWVSAWVWVPDENLVES